MPEGRPQIFDYLDFRLFVKATIHFMKERGVSSYAVNRDSGFKSPTHLKLIVEGKRNLTDKSARQLAKGLQLNSNETEFFVVLVSYTQESDERERRMLYRKLVRFKQLSAVQRLALHQFEAFSNWQSIAILEAIATDWRKNSESVMAESLGCSLKELREAIDTLLKAELIERRGGEWIKKDSILHMPVEARHESIQKLHREMLKKGSEAIDRDSPNDRANFGLGLALSRKSFLEFKERIADFLKDIGAEYQDEAQAEEIYYAGVQIFSICKLKH